MDEIVRQAKLEDLERLVEFTLSEARDAENAVVDREKAREGIGAALEDDSLALYWVLQKPDHKIIGNISIVKEWSNWRAGYYWWVQSLYIEPEHRGRGLMNELLRKVGQAAREEGALELRLYAHKDNERAIRAYLKAGFRVSPYMIMTMKAADF